MGVVCMCTRVRARARVLVFVSTQGSHRKAHRRKTFKCLCWWFVNTTPNECFCISSTFYLRIRWNSGVIYERSLLETLTYFWTELLWGDWGRDILHHYLSRGRQWDICMMMSFDYDYQNAFRCNLCNVDLCHARAIPQKKTKNRIQ